MKKVLFIMALVLLCIPAIYADKVSSTSRSIMTIKEERNYKSNFLVKLGGGAVKYRGRNKFAYNAVFGYQRQFSTLGLYWGGQLGVQNTPHRTYWGSIDNAAGLYIMPTFGLNRACTGTGLDAHVGIGYLYNKDSNLKWEVGLGFWFNKYLVEVQYIGSGTVSGRDSDNYIKGVLLNLGFRF